VKKKNHRNKKMQIVFDKISGCVLIDHQKRRYGMVTEQQAREEEERFESPRTYERRILWLEGPKRGHRETATIEVTHRYQAASAELYAGRIFQSGQLGHRYLVESYIRIA
jgi:hypothetical protein